METFIDLLAQNWHKIVIPIVVFVFCTMALLQLKNIAFKRLSSWSAVAKWPVDIILIEPIKRPAFIQCVILGAYLGLAASIISGEWKSVVGHSLWTLFIFTLALAILNVLRELIPLLLKRLNLPVGKPIIWTITKIIVIAISVLFVLGVWGVPTGPLLLLVAIASFLILLAMRDAAPNFFAGFQITTWQHLKVGDLVKLENGEEGRITRLGWTNAHLQTTEGNSIIIPNSQLTKQTVVKIEKPLKKQEESDHLSILTEREMEITKLISKGTTNKEIAKLLFITENTAKVHVKNILKKLELKNRQQLAAFAVSKDGIEEYAGVTK